MKLGLLPAVSVQPVDRHHFFGGSDAGIITDTGEAFVFWTRRERRPDVELEDVSNRRWYAASIGQEPLGSGSGAVAPEHSYPASVPELE